MNLAVSIGISLAVFIVFASLLEAMRRRGFDPVADIARFISPDVTTNGNGNGNGNGSGMEVEA